MAGTDTVAGPLGRVVWRRLSSPRERPGVYPLLAALSPGDRGRILAAGCDGYLAKPIQPQALPAVLRRLLDRPIDGVAGRGGRRPSGDEEHGAHTAG